MGTDKLFYSNCLLESLKAVIRSGFSAKLLNLTYLSKHKKGVHYGWRGVDNKVFHFASLDAGRRPWWKNLWIKGKIVKLKD